MHRLSNWISNSANDIINKYIVNKSSMIPKTNKKTSKAWDLGPQFPNCAQNQQRRHMHRGKFPCRHNDNHIHWTSQKLKSAHDSMYYIQINDIPFCEIGCSATALIKSKYCVKMKVKQEMKTAVFNLIPRLCRVLTNTSHYVISKYGFFSNDY